MSFFRNFDEEDEVTYPKWERIFFAIGSGLIFIGIILKYNSLPYSRYFLMAGIGVALVSFFMGIFSKDLEDE